MNKTFIRTFRSDNTKIHDVELFGGQDDARVALFCVRRAMAVGGYAVVITNNDALSISVFEQWNGYLAAVSEGYCGDWHDSEVAKGYAVALIHKDEAAYSAMDAEWDLNLRNILRRVF